MALQDFLTTFSSSVNRNRRIDPLKFFNVFMDVSNVGGRVAKGFTTMGLGGNPIDLSMFVQSITLPKIDIPAEELQTLFGSVKMHEMRVIPSSQDLTMSIINTEIPIHETVFYPWMREITSPIWVYEEFPYSKATIYVSKDQKPSFEYVFIGARPTSITAKEASNEASGQVTRDVVFAFDYLAIRSFHS